MYSKIKLSVSLFTVVLAILNKQKFLKSDKKCNPFISDTISGVNYYPGPFFSGGKSNRRPFFRGGGGVFAGGNQ